MAIARITITQSVLALLNRHRIFTQSAQGDRWRVGDAVRVDEDAVLEPYSHLFQGHAVPRAMGAFSYAFSPLDPHLAVGRYCSISWAVELMGSKHPDHWASTSPISHNPGPLPGVAAYLRDSGATSYTVHGFDQGPQAVTIGHDIWIGAGAMMKRGITIGTGAIIGARSTVLHDVPPYAVVAGTPARLVRMRFPESLAERLMASQWWRYGPDVVQAADPRSPEAFLDRLTAAVEAGAQPFTPETLTGRHLIDAART